MTRGINSPQRAEKCTAIEPGLHGGFGSKLVDAADVIEAAFGVKRSSMSPRILVFGTAVKMDIGIADR
jgi:hypothetical protein